MTEKLSKSRKRFMRIIDSTDKILLAQRTYHHPVFGEMNLTQWILFVGLHEKRHLAQIEELKEKAWHKLSREFFLTYNVKSSSYEEATINTRLF